MVAFQVDPSERAEEPSVDHVDGKGAGTKADPVKEDAAFDSECFGSAPQSNLFRISIQDVISFENLRVTVPGKKSCLPSLGPLSRFAWEYCGHSKSVQQTFSPVKSVSGYIKSGELVLLLGPTGSGRTSLLRALSGRLNEKDQVEGAIRLNGTPVDVSDPRWRTYTTFVSSADDQHSPVLTVEETLRFAAKCTPNKTGGSAPVAERVDHMLEMLGLEHVRNTVVGDERLRGVSGGQKRRITIGEMLINENAPFLFLDDVSQGLDSVTTMDLVRNIKRGCKEIGFGALVTLKGASDEVIQLADKVMVLDQSGSLAYYGPSDVVSLQRNFERLRTDRSKGAHKCIVESILQGCMAPQLARGPDAKSTAACRFDDSSARAHLEKELGAMRNRAEAAGSGGGQTSDALLREIVPQTYPTSTAAQIRNIAWRQVLLTKRNSMTIVRPFIALFFAFIVATLFSVANQDLIGAVAVVGFLFLSMFLVLMLSAAVTTPENFRQRPAIYKHRGACWYSPWTRYAVQVVIDLPLSILEAAIIACIPYFVIPGLNHDLHAFGYFLGVLIAVELVGQAFGRMIAAFIPTQVFANVVTTLGIFAWGMMAGFLPPYTSTTWVLRWFSWINPAAYAYEGLMINQFSNHTLYLLQLGGSDGSPKLSLLPMSGTKTVLGIEGLPRVQWGSNSDIAALDLGMLFVFAIIFDVLGALLSERGRHWYSNRTRRPRAAVFDRFKSTRGDSLAFHAHKKSGEGATEQPAEETLARKFSKDTDGLWHPQCLSLRKLSYEVKHEGKTLRLLDRVNAEFTRGTMTALMGSSGAGKSTLMDCIAGMKTGGHVSGRILVDGVQKVGTQWRRVSSYAEQNDVFNPYLSAKETLLITSWCRHVQSREEHEDWVERLLQVVDLGSVANLCIGKEQDGSGLAKHERKRLTIANALVQRPDILFCDEPTSGLGILEATKIMKVLRQATNDLGLITLVTIHQPGNLFYRFDNALVLAKKGRVAYCGEVGRDAGTVLQYFANVLIKGDSSPALPNGTVDPADFILATIDTVPDAAKQFHHSEMAAALRERIDASAKVAQASDESIQKVLSARMFAKRPSGWSKFGTLVFRHFLVDWRNPRLSLARLQVSVMSAIFLGILFLGLDNSIMGAVNSIAVLFYIVFSFVIPMQSAVVPLIEDRAVLYKDAKEGTYSRFNYGLSHFVAALPFHFVNAMAFFILYYIAGLRDGPEFAGFFFLLIFLCNWLIPSIGQLFAYACPNEESANGLAGLAAILSVIFCGFLLAARFFPSAWVWAYQANAFRWALQGLITNQVAGQRYALPPLSALSGLLPFQLPSFDAQQLADNGPRGLASHDDDTVAGGAAAAPSWIQVGQDGLVESNDQQDMLEMINRTLQESSIRATSVPEDPLAMIHLVECMFKNHCFSSVEVMATCTIFQRGQCHQEFQLAGQQALDTVECLLPNPDIHDAEERLECLVHTLLPVSIQPLVIKMLHWVDEHWESIDKILEQLIASWQLCASQPGSFVDHLECVAEQLLPAELMKLLERLLQELKNLGVNLGNLIRALLDILSNGLPGDLLLLFFGWAKIDSLDASGIHFETYKWFPSFFAVSMFIVGVEALKLVAVSFICYIKR